VVHHDTSMSTSGSRGLKKPQSSLGQNGKNQLTEPSTLNKCTQRIQVSYEE